MKDFYPSITESLMKKALDFAETHTHALQKKIKLLLDIPENHCCFKKDKHGWKKSYSFDLTMEANGGVEFYELVGVFLLDWLSWQSGYWLI